MKIISTIGPATQENFHLKKIIVNSDIIRLNFSHNTYDWHQSIIQKIRKINKLKTILVDIPGVKPRTHNEKVIEIKNKQIVCFGDSKQLPNVINIKLTNLLPKNRKIGPYFSVDDGKFLFKTIKSGKNFILGVSQQKFLLHPKKGLNLPGSIYDEKKQEIKYLEFINKIQKLDINAIGLSYVQSQKVIKNIKKKIFNKSILIISKIENTKGLINVEKIAMESDVIMIDRGDLLAEIGHLKFIDSIDKINEICKRLSKPLIIATQNFTNKDNLTPSINDIISIGFFEKMKADALMLSEETATSKLYNEKFKLLRNIKSKQSTFNKSEILNIWNYQNFNKPKTYAIFSKKGYSIDKVFKIDVHNNINIFTENNKVYHLCNFRNNTNAFLISKFPKKNYLKFALKQIKLNLLKIFKNSNKILLYYIANPHKNSSLNSISILSKQDIEKII